jgi:hypothetical protein
MSHQFTCEDCQKTFNATSSIDETPVNHPAYCEPGVDDDFSLCDDCSVKFETSWKLRYGAAYPYFSPPFQYGGK